MQLFGLLLDFAGQLVNPLDAGSTFVDWIFSISVVTPVAFIVMRYLVHLGAGYKFRQIVMRKERQWTRSKSK